MRWLSIRSKQVIVVVMIFIALAAVTGLRSRSVLAESSTVIQAPMFEVDPLWPKPLPNHWVLGRTIGVSIDSKNHVWIVHRVGTLEPGEKHATTTPPIAQCCAPAPPVLEFDEAGNLLRSWGGPGDGYDWPESLHGITVDYKGNVWIGGQEKARQLPRTKVLELVVIPSMMT